MSVNNFQSQSQPTHRKQLILDGQVRFPPDTYDYPDDAAQRFHLQSNYYSLLSNLSEKVQCVNTDAQVSLLKGAQKSKYMVAIHQLLRENIPLTQPPLFGSESSTFMDFIYDWKIDQPFKVQATLNKHTFLLEYEYQYQSDNANEDENEAFGTEAYSNNMCLCIPYLYKTVQPDNAQEILEFNDKSHLMMDYQIAQLENIVRVKVQNRQAEIIEKERQARKTRAQLLTETQKQANLVKQTTQASKKRKPDSPDATELSDFKKLFLAVYNDERPPQVIHPSFQKQALDVPKRILEFDATLELSKRIYKMVQLLLTVI